MFKKNIILFVSIVFLSHELLAQGFFGNIANVVSNLLENQRQSNPNQGGGAQQPQYPAQRQYQPQYQAQPQYQSQYQYQTQPQYQSQQPDVSPGSAAFGFPAAISTPVPSPVASVNPTVSTPIPVNSTPVQITSPIAPTPIPTASVTPASFNVAYDSQNKEFSTPTNNVQQYEKGVVSIPGGFPVYYDPQNRDFMSDTANILPYEITKIEAPVVPPAPVVTPPPPPPVDIPAPVITPIPAVAPTPVAVVAPPPVVVAPPPPVVVPVVSHEEPKFYNPLDETIADFTDSRDIFDKNLLPQEGLRGSAEGLKPISKIPALGQMLCERCMRGQFANSPEASDECIRQCIVIYRGLFNPDLSKNDQSFPDTSDSLSLENAYQKGHSQALNRRNDNGAPNNIVNQENQRTQQNGGGIGQGGQSSVKNLNPYTAVDEPPLLRRLPSATARKRPGAAGGAR